MLSSGNLALPGAAANGSAELFRTRKTATQLSISSASGIKGGTTTLVATLTSYGSPLAGKSIRFQVQGRVFGKAKTDAQGVATLTNVKLKGISAGMYSRGVGATFTGNANFKLSSAGPR